MEHIMPTMNKTAALGARNLLAILAVLWCGAALAQDVKYDYDRSADFAKYKTYRWVPIEGAQQPDQLTHKNITTVLDEQLLGKGLTKKEADPVDLYVGYQVSVSKETQVTTFNNGPGWRYGGMGTATTSTIHVGTLVFDVYDPAAKSLIWRGSATDTLDPSSDPDKRMKRLRKAMGKLLKNFPPQPKSGK
jgi:hypothetical protein